MKTTARRKPPVKVPLPFETFVEGVLKIKPADLAASRKKAAAKKKRAAKK